MSSVKLLVLSVQNRPGAVADVLAALSDAGIDLRSILGWAPQNVLELVVTDPAAAGEVLAGNGIAFTEHDAQIVELANQPGALHTYLAALARDFVNLRSLSGFASADGQVSYVVWTAETGGHPSSFPEGEAYSI